MKKNTAYQEPPCIQLAHLPTPFEPLPALSKYLGGPNIYVKRDDCTGLAGGGNKTRKLEYLMADAVAKGADVIVTVGATQSNHVRQSVAAAAKLGLDIHVFLQKDVVRDDDYARNGNFMLNGLMGAIIHEVLPDRDLNERGVDFSNGLTRQGRKPYFIPIGGSSPIGAYGYRGCAREIVEQAEAASLDIDAIFVASGSFGTQAGLVVGMMESQKYTPIHGISVSKPRAELEAGVYALAIETAKLTNLTSPVPRESVICHDEYYAPGYGEPNKGMIEALRLCATLEGLLLDPVYSGKAMAALISHIRKGAFLAGQNVVFVHTGGQTALHAYRSVFDDAAT